MSPIYHTRDYEQLAQRNCNTTPSRPQSSPKLQVGCALPGGAGLLESAMCLRHVKVWSSEPVLGSAGR